MIIRAIKKILTSPRDIPRSAESCRADDLVNYRGIILDIVPRHSVPRCRVSTVKEIRTSASAGVVASEVGNSVRSRKRS